MRFLRKIFIDSSAFIALADRSENNHLAAVEFVTKLPSSVKRVTSDYVLDETVTRVRSLFGVEAAYRVGGELLSEKYQMVVISRPLCARALEKMRKYSDHRFSFTDCTSFLVMEELEIVDVFAFDDDFKRVGFRVHPSIA